MREFDCSGVCLKDGWVLKEQVHVLIEPPRVISNEVKCAVLKGRVCMAANTAIVSPNAAPSVDHENRPAPEKCPYL